MRLTLKRHPDSRGEAVASIDVEALRANDTTLVLHYSVAGKIKDIRLPAQTNPARVDELWRHTCFEAFVRDPGNGAYLELNFSPSTQWAAYRFGAYRSAMLIATEVEAPRIQTQSTGARFSLQTSVDLSRAQILPSAAVWQLGLSAVIEEEAGQMSYWALTHPSGKADFHHSDCFAQALPPTLQR